MARYDNALRDATQTRDAVGVAETADPSCCDVCPERSNLWSCSAVRSGQGSLEAGVAAPRRNLSLSSWTIERRRVAWRTRGMDTGEIDGTRAALRSRARGIRRTSVVGCSSASSRLRKRLP